MMVEFEGRIFCARTVNEARKRRFLIKKTYQENEGNKMIIICLSFCKKQTNKTKEKSVCPKGFLLTLTTSDFFPLRSQQVCIESLHKLNSHTKTRFQVDKLFGFYQYPVRARAEEGAEKETKKVHQHLFWRPHISMSLLFCFILVVIYYV